MERVDKGGCWTVVNIYTHQIGASKRIPLGHISGPKSTFSVSGVLSIKFYLLENILSSFLEIDVSHLYVIKLKECCSRLQSERQYIGSGGGMSQGGVWCRCWQGCRH